MHVDARTEPQGYPRKGHKHRDGHVDLPNEGRGIAGEIDAGDQAAVVA